MGDPFAGWENGPERPRLKGDEVHVWGWGLEGAVEDLAWVRAVLSAEEVRRMGAFRFTPDRERYARARAGLRRILGRYVGVEPGAVRFVYGEYGKPGLDPEQGDIQFNLSHTPGVAVAAFCVPTPVGVDVEHRTPVSRVLGEQVFSAREQATLDRLCNVEYEVAFFKGWTRKEAVSKAEGLGLHLPTQNFSVSLLPGEPAQVEDAGGVLSRTWRLVELPLGKGMVGCLAAGVKVGAVRMYRMRWETPLA